MDLKTSFVLIALGRGLPDYRRRVHPVSDRHEGKIESFTSRHRPGKQFSRRPAVLFRVGICSLLLMHSNLSAGEKRKPTVADAEKRFNELDRNKDGKLSEEEFPKAKLFAVIDADHDGFISLEESRAHFLNRASRASEDADGSGTNAKTSTQSGSRQRCRTLKPAECSVGRIVPDVTFRDIDGHDHRSSEFKSHAATVVAAINPNCSISKQFVPTLARLEATYAKNVRFVFVSPTLAVEIGAIREIIQTNALKGLYVLDPEGMFLSALGATSSTDCFVIDKALTLRYRGAVDDQYGPGFALEQPKQSLLVDALDAVLAGRTPRIAATEAPGSPLSFGKSSTRSALKISANEFTYHNRISRIVQSNCVECHHEGGVAPFSLEQFEDVAAHAAMISRVVKNGTMPPWFAAPAGKAATNVWANDRSLTAADKSDLLDWLGGQRPVGDPSDAPVATVFTDGWHLGEPDSIIQIPSPIAVAAEGVMPYQQVVVETKFDEDKWVRGFDIRPTARAVVHHVGVFIESGPSPEKKGDEAENTGRYLALYVPGNSWRLFPNGYAKRLPKNARLRFQIHYTPNGTAADDQTRLGLYFSKQPPTRELYVTGVLNRGIKIPPKVPDHKESGVIGFPNDIQILSILPHMHVRGKAFRLEAISKGGTSTTLLNIPNYDANWQLGYELAEPYSLPKGAKLKIRGVFDNSARNPANPDPSQTVYWGLQSTDEMLIGYVEYVVLSDDLTSKDR